MSGNETNVHHDSSSVLYNCTYLKIIKHSLKQKSNPLDKSSVERAIDIMNVLTVHDTSADSFDDRVYEVIKLLADPNTGMYIHVSTLQYYIFLYVDVITSGIPFSNYEDFVHQLTK